jgi:hypothetical protein
LPGKHSSGPVGLARLLPARFRLRSLPVAARTLAARLLAARRRRRIAAAAVALLLLVGGSIRMFTGDRPALPLFVATPVMPVGEVVLSTAPDAEPDPVPEPPATSLPAPGHPVATTTVARHGSDAGRGTRPEAAPRKPKPSPDGPGPTAVYAVSGSWDTGFIAGVVLSNPTSTSRSWRVVITHDPADGVRVTTAWNARLERSGSSSILTGGPLAPGASQTFGFEATKRVSGPVRPTACTVDGAACAIR